MSEPIARHQLFEYEENEPFLVLFYSVGKFIKSYFWRG